jgi:hypothetical protein
MFPVIAILITQFLKKNIRFMGIQTKGVHPKNPYELMTIPKVWLNPIQLLG